MIHSLQIHMLCKLILAARTHSTKDVPTWAEPVIRLFDLTIFPWGQDLDILYAPVSTSSDYAQSHRWTKLEDYWHSVLFIWNIRLRKKITRRQSRFDKLSTSMLHNVDITYKGNGRTLAGQPKPSGLPLSFADHLIFRPSDLFRFAVIPLRVRLCLRFFIHFARIVFLEKVSASFFWLAFIVCWDLFANSPLNQFPLSNTMALFMTEYSTLMSCRSLVYQEFGPFLSSTLTQFYHCHAWNWMKHSRGYVEP